MINFKETILSESAGVKELGRNRVVRMWPDWTKAKKDENANAFLLLGQGSLPISELNRSYNMMQLNMTASNVDFWEPGNLYKYAIPSDYIFEYKNTTNGIEYITPDIITGDGIELIECKYRDINEFLFALPSGLKSTEDVADYTEIVMLPEDLINPDYEFYIEKTNGKFAVKIEVEPGWDWDSLNSLINNGSSEFRYIEIYNKQFPNIKATINVYREDSYEINRDLPPGKYKIRTNLIGFKVTLNSWGFCSNITNYYDSIYTSSGNSNAYFKISEEGDHLELKHYLTGRADYNAYPINYRNYKLMDADDESVTINSIAMHRNYPWILGLSSEGESSSIYLWSVYEKESPFIYSSNSVEILSIYSDMIDYKVGDQITFKTRLNSWNPKIKITKIRMKVMNENGDSFYINRSGVAVDERAAWVDTARGSDYNWFDVRWNFNIELSGYYKVEIETTPIDSNEVVKIAQHIINVPYKKALKKIDLPFAAVNISVGRDGKVYVLDSEDELKEVNLLYNTYYMNYDTYELYTRTEFDEIVL
jgi:hypothetical protein